jgi:hypothetical protein
MPEVNGRVAQFGRVAPFEMPAAAKIETNLLSLVAYAGDAKISARRRASVTRGPTTATLSGTSSKASRWP